MLVRENSDISQLPEADLVLPTTFEFKAYRRAALVVFGKNFLTSATPEDQPYLSIVVHDELYPFLNNYLMRVHSALTEEAVESESELLFQNAIRAWYKTRYVEGERRAFSPVIQIWKKLVVNPEAGERVRSEALLWELFLTLKVDDEIGLTEERLITLSDNPDPLTAAAAVSQLSVYYQLKLRNPALVTVLYKQHYPRFSQEPALTYFASLMSNSLKPRQGPPRPGSEPSPEP